MISEPDIERWLKLLLAGSGQLSACARARVGQHAGIRARVDIYLPLSAATSSPTYHQRHQHHQPKSPVSHHSHVPYSPLAYPNLACPAGDHPVSSPRGRPDRQFGLLHTHRSSNGCCPHGYCQLYFEFPFERLGPDHVPCQVPRLRCGLASRGLLHLGPGLCIRRFGHGGLLSVPDNVCREAGCLWCQEECSPTGTGGVDIAVACCGGGCCGRRLLGPWLEVLNEQLMCWSLML